MRTVREKLKDDVLNHCIIEHVFLEYLCLFVLEIIQAE